MRISLLLQREPFGEILERTLSGFFKSHFDQSVSIKWRPRYASAQTSQGQFWICNPFLNAIFIPGLRRKYLLPLIKEFSRSPIWWRTPLQKVYVALSVAKLTCKIFAGPALEITPGLSGAETLLIVGGNHHVRMLDANYGKNYVILKHGFDNELLLNDVRVREENLFLPAPPITKVSKNGSWYEEDFILGTPINRLKSSNQKKKAIESILPPLFRLYESTVQSVSRRDYADEICSRILVLVEENRHFDTDSRERFKLVSETCRKILNSCKDDTIVTVQSHGDLQPANILAGGGQTWLIDWEYTAVRQAAYDGLVFGLQSRFPSALSRRIRPALEGKSPGMDRWLSRFPFVKWQNLSDRRFVMALFLLEELELRLREVSNPIFFNIGRGLEVFVTEMEHTLKHL